MSGKPPPTCAFLVDLTGQLSNPCPALRRMLDTTYPQVSSLGEVPSTESRPRQKQVRLSQEEQVELVARHKEDAFKRELARAYGVHVETVRAIIKRHCTHPKSVLPLPMPQPNLQAGGRKRVFGPR